MPGTTSILLSLPSGGSRHPWCVVNLADGRITRGSAMPGHLRAAPFPASHAEDQRPWVLGTYGLGRLQLQGRPAITDVTRKGLGSYQGTLLDLGDGLLGVGRRRGASMLLVSAADGHVVKRLRAPGPGIAYSLPDGTMRCSVCITAKRVTWTPASARSRPGMTCRTASAPTTPAAT